MTTTTTFRFDGKNVTAQRVAARQGARLVTAVTAETKAALRALVARSIRDGIPVYDAARMIRSMVGMTERQASAAQLHRTQLIDMGLSIDKVDARVARFVEKKIRERADVIARTETMAALNEGALEGYRQARADGWLDEAAMKEWMTTPDERLCLLVCAPMDGVRVPLGEPFRTSDGDMDGPPAHPNCRCSVVVVP